jgi:hypothetical protein
VGLPHVVGDTSAPAAGVHTHLPLLHASLSRSNAAIHPPPSRRLLTCTKQQGVAHTDDLQDSCNGPLLTFMACVVLSRCFRHLLPPGLDTNPDRPDDKLPYRGAWLWIGPEMIHLMELPNPDPTERAKRPGEGRLSQTLTAPACTQTLSYLNVCCTSRFGECST